jgi:CHAD domain-containing protein
MFASRRGFGDNKGMAFRLKKSESVPKGVKRLIRREIDQASAGLRNGDTGDEAIHDTRKRLKKIRAVLRLVRDALGKEVYQRENRAFRDAARPLTELRDAKVLLDALAQLKERPGRPLTEAQLTALDRGLQANLRSVRKHVLEEENGFAGSLRALAQARDRVGKWSFSAKGWSALGLGLKRIYKNGHRALAAAAAEPSVANLHEWRKEAKYLWHQLQVLEPACPDALGKLANEFRELTQLLGDDHDLAVLHETVAANAKAFGGEKVVQALTRVLARRRAELQQQAFLVGSHLYQEPPRVFTRRIKQCWKAWRATR